MTIANWCVLTACLLPIATVGLAKGGSATLKSDAGRYDNENPRVWAQGLSGWRQRANAAQQNGFEALPVFIAAILLAQQAHADQTRIDQLALLLIAFRIVYIITYLMGQGTLRTLVWAGGLATAIGIFFLS